jgi:CRP-like cAMP-binding protein
MRPNDVPRNVIDALGAVPLYAGCSTRQLRALASLGAGVHVRAGERLTLQGRPGSEFFLITAGTARCLRDGVEVARFGPGDWFGEGALLDGGRRTATVVADTAMDVVVFDRREFASLHVDIPAVGGLIEASDVARQGATR